MNPIGGQQTSSVVESISRLLEQSKFKEAATLAQGLIDSGDEEAKAAGTILYATAVGQSAVSGSAELSNAIRLVRSAYEAAPNSGSARLLANLLMTEGAGGYSESYLLLSKWVQKEASAPLHLGLARCFRNKPAPDLQLAQRHYLLAAIRGRVAGVVGYGELALKQEQFLRTILATVLLPILSGLFRVLLGSKSKELY